MKFKQRFYPLLNISPFSLASLISHTKMPLLLPTYHTINNHSLPHLKHLYPIKNTHQFVEDIDFLLQNFQSVSIFDIQKHLTKEKIITKPSFHLSFDDGMRDCIEIIAPILKKKGVHASFYINSDFVDNQHLFYRHKVSVMLEKMVNTSKTPTQITHEAIAEKILIQEDLWKGNLTSSILGLKFHHQNILTELGQLLEVSVKDYLSNSQPYMNSLEIKQLYRDGFHIGAHSVSHPNYQDISEEEQIQQTLQSVDFVKKHFPSKVTTFAFPYSSIGIHQSFFDTINQSVDITFGTSGLKWDSIPNHLHRFPMEGANFHPKTMIKGEYSAFLLKKWMGKTTFERS